LALEQIAAGGLYIGNIVSAWFSQSFLKGTPVFPFWTLAEEEQFYFVWPLLLVILLRRRVRESRVAWLIACIFFVLVVHRARLASAGANIDRLYLAPDTHSDALVLGCLLAFLRRGGLRISQPIGWLGLAALVIVSSLFAPGGGWSANMVGPMAIAATLLVGAALEVGFLSRCLALRPLPWVGEISYSLYLWHFFVFWLFDWRSPFLCLALTLMVATLSYYKVERPLRKGLRPWRGKESPAQLASEQVVAVGPPSELDVVTSPAR
jgi:peptidoglycan/LPS O-acetylase OafA/YrhL